MEAAGRDAAEGPQTFGTDVSESDYRLIKGSLRRHVLDFTLTTDRLSAAKAPPPPCRALCVDCGSESLPGGSEGRLV